MRARAARFGLLLAALVLLAGCEFRGLNSLELPGAQGLGDEPFTVTVEVPDAASLVNNSEVKVGDATVGAVTDIRAQNFAAVMTVKLNQDTVLPTNTTARVGLKSLLGASYLELAPPTDEPAVGKLRDGDRIALGPPGNYPETEQVLAAASVLLNGGGLDQLNTITTELNNALDGRQEVARDLLGNLNEFTGRLNAQRADIVRALDGFDRLAAGLERRRPQLAAAIDGIPPALDVLNREQDSLTRTLVSVNNLGGVARRVLDRSREDLLSNLRDLQPTLQRLADAGDALPRSLISAPTGIFPVTTGGNAARGDYLNLSATIDLTLPALDKAFLTGTPLAGLLGRIPAAQASNPLTAPLQPLMPGAPGVAGGDPPVDPGTGDDRTGGGTDGGN